ncbi:hypothetical protein GWI33_012904 [Rhynchophorus ferrugineus]|uniref:PiggyBac transposable element-derived protein domain-containing protein n=1 Tax=Rhynchophorus ferrugineus TaxID=354439 RepID=A0A834I4G9_RHYFE|nr:hypothetical protein GWI33_012904 [Rhynchophorus ferrugineus]
MAEAYYPGRELVLGGPMVLWRGRLVFRENIRNKHHKYGVKLCTLSTPNGMVQKFAVYTDMADDLGDNQHAKKVVIYLIQGKLNVGHSVYLDNYYNSHDLARSLLEQKTHCTVTLRTARKNTPRAIQKTRLKKG